MKRAQDEGGMHGLGLNVDDCQKTYEELAPRASSSSSRRRERPYGTEACRDNSGNWLVLVEPASEPYTADDFKPTVPTEQSQEVRAAGRRSPSHGHTNQLSRVRRCTAMASAAGSRIDGDRRRNSI